jgi:hypothetical protein
VEQGRFSRRNTRHAIEGRAPRGSKSPWLRRRHVHGVQQLHAGAERHVHEVRYVWKHDGVFVMSIM